MLCVNCKKNEATTYYKQVSDGMVTEMMLCPKCAPGVIVSPTLSYDSDIGFGDMVAGLMSKSSSRAVGDMPKKQRCGLCGSSFDDLVKAGKIGCAECYEIFHDKLLPSIEGIHGSVPYRGHIPNSAGEAIKKEREIQSLQTAMSIAIQEQDFEHAAVLRDKIKALTAEGGDGHD
jgi:protein arginine kinase activator